MIAAISITILIGVFVALYIGFGQVLIIPDFVYTGIDYLFDYAGRGAKLILWIFPSEEIFETCLTCFIACLGISLLIKLFNALMRFVSAFKFG